MGQGEGSGGKLEPLRGDGGAPTQVQGCMCVCMYAYIHEYIIIHHMYMMEVHLEDVLHTGAGREMPIRLPPEQTPSQAGGRRVPTVTA